MEERGSCVSGVSGGRVSKSFTTSCDTQTSYAQSDYSIMSFHISLLGPADSCQFRRTFDCLSSGFKGHYLEREIQHHKTPVWAPIECLQSLYGFSSAISHKPYKFERSVWRLYQASVSITIHSIKSSIDQFSIVSSQLLYDSVSFLPLLVSFCDIWMKYSHNETRKLTNNFQSSLIHHKIQTITNIQRILKKCWHFFKKNWLFHTATKS